MHTYRSRSPSRMTTIPWLRQALRPTPTTSRSIPQLDGLRGLAVLAIVLLHSLQPIGLSFLTSTFGAWTVLNTGVQLFFVLSGFLLFLPFARYALTGERKPPVSKYFERRALRILPAYWSSLLIFVIFLVPSYSQHGIIDFALHVVLLQDLLASTNRGINAPFWTMAVEAQFYVLLPLISVLGYGALRARRPRTAFLTLASVIIVTALLAYGYSLGSDHLFRGLHPYVFALSVLEYLPVFSVGIAVSFIYAAAIEELVNRDTVHYWARLGGVLGFALLIALILGSRFALNAYRYIVAQQGAGFAFGGIMLAALLGYESWARWLSRPTLRFFGMVSYSMYIWNQVILSWAALHGRHLFRSQWGALLSTLTLGFVLTTAIATLSYILVERPFISKRRRLHQPDSSPLASPTRPAHMKGGPSRLATARDPSRPGRDGIIAEVGNGSVAPG
jgi:peptidoglycan/LPS O-acetylase OafA/YrhL